jgi:hypothetical protein
MTSSCNHKNWIAASIIAFAVAFGYDYLVHGVLLMDMYTATASLWRPEAEMQALGYVCMLSTFVIVTLVAGAYQCWRSKVVCGAVGSSDCPYRKSMGFGLLVGLIIGIVEAKSYVWIAIPAELALAWLAAEVIKWTILGIVLEVVYSKLKSKSA